ncbi:hypothetical protein LCGC14_1168630 [marine sediment metagenome]|uniref:Uncharacterized protein n=1 Tax=marine sediment metagenome TaxID=412755 RepID=A0A0F9LVD1_9ZZZZ
MKSILNKLHAFFITGWVPIELRLRIGRVYVSFTFSKLDVRSPTIGATMTADLRRSTFFFILEAYAGVIGLSVDAYTKPNPLIRDGEATVENAAN